MNRRHFLKTSVAAAVAASLPAHAGFEDVLHRPTQVGADINAITGDGGEVILKIAQVQELSDSLKGKLLLPGHAAYDEARSLLNPGFDKYPALVVQPTGPADVSSALQFANDNRLLVAVKCGGHSHSGKSTCDGGMQIDLSTFRYCHVDPFARTATVAGGSLLGELDHEAMAHGLVTTAGTVSHTGVGGLTLGGGFGRLARRYGLTIDNVLAFDIVTPDGELRRASAEQNPDLYWALRGGGGNFGIVTAFVFQLHPMQREVVSGRFTFPLAEAKQVMNFFGEYADGAADDMHVSIGLGASPGMPAPVASIGFVYSGDPGKVEKLIAPIRKAGKPTNETVKTWDYVVLQRSGDTNDPRANGSYVKSGFVGAFTPDIVDDIVDNFEMHPERATWVGTQQSGGAIGRIANDATAFAHREAQHNVLSFVGWKFGADPTEHVTYIKSHWDKVAPHTRGFYTNDVFEETQEEINANYRGNYARLLEIKQKYDPTNLLRLNANIKPA